MPLHPKTHIKVHPLIVRDKPIDVYVSLDGHFSATFNERHYTDDTQRGLYSQLMVATKRALVKVAVPFVVLREHRDGTHYFKEGVATGIHSSTGKVLVKWSHEETDQISAYGFKAYEPMDQATADRFIVLQVAADTAIKALKDFASDHDLDLRREVEAAIKAAVVVEAE